MIRIAVMLMLASFATVHAASIDLVKPVVRDSAHVVTVVTDSTTPLDGWTVSAVYYPGSTVERVDSVGVTDSTGKTSWTPKFAGIVALKASREEMSASKNVGVQYPGVPAGAVIVFLLAGAILLGGAGWSLIHLIEHKPVPEDENA